MGDNNTMFGGEGTWIWVFFLFFLLAWGGNGFGFGGNNGATQALLTQGQLYDGLYNQTIDANLRSISGQQLANHEAVMNAECNLSQLMLTNKYDAAMQAAAIQNQQQMCCCETNRNLDSIKYENARNTCDIINASNANTQRIIDMMTANTIQELRDKLQTAQLEANNTAQTATLISTLRPFPQPAYITCSPYTAANGVYGCGCGM